MTNNKENPSSIENHKGNLFFPLPDGSALLYTLIGKSSSPLPVSISEIKLRAKKSNVHIIEVKNWLRELQRFEVNWVMEQEEPSLFISGAKTIDIAGETIKPYKLSIYGLKQTSAKVNVYFKNLKTNEFIFYKLTLSLAEALPEAKIELSSIIRESVSKLITIENPLDKPVIVKKEQFSTDNDNISFLPSSFTIPEKSEFGFEVVFRPLLITTVESKFSLKSPELGEFIYPLTLVGMASTQTR